MTVHPETIEAVKIIRRYDNQFRGEDSILSSFGISMGALVDRILDELDDENTSEEQKTHLTQTLGFIINNPKFVKAYLDD